MDKTVCLFARYLFKEAKAYVEDELVLEKPAFTTERLAAMIKEKMKSLGYNKITRAVADNNNPILIADLNSLHSLTFYPTLKDELEAQINEVRLWVGAGRVLVHPRVKELIGCLRNGIFDKKRQFARSVLYGHFDALAALMYLIRNIDATHNPVPATFGMTRETHAVELIPKNEQSQSMKTLKKLFKNTQMRPVWK